MPKLGIKMPKMGTKRIARTTAARLRAGAAPRAAHTPRQLPAPTSIADALFSTTQQRLIGLLFGQPERSFFATELIRLAGAGSGAVQRELARMSESGLLTVNRVGNQKHYQANPQSPVFSELRAIAVKTFGIADLLREALQPLTDRVSLALLYGSIVKGEAHAGSDVDVLIVADDLDLETVFDALAPLESRLGRKVSPALYTQREFRKRVTAKHPFITKVLAGPHIVLLGQVDAAA
jgi:predicted nucleotidyltransferase/predicted transcriptional regulator